MTAASTAAPSGAERSSQPRRRARSLAAGRGRYLDDLRLPRLAHAAFLRSPHAHARIVRIDLAPARALPGVCAVFDAAAIGTVCRPWTTRLATFPQHRSPPQPPLAGGRTLWQGQPVAIAIAESRAAAEDAVAAMVVEWEECEPLADPALALAAGAPPIHPELGSNLAFEHRIAPAGAAAAGPAVHRVIRRRFGFARHTGVPLEGRGLIAEFDPAVRRLTVHHSTQVPHQTRAILAECFGLPEQDIRVVVPDVGGGFGIKLHCYDDEMAVCAAAVLLGRPVKFVSDRLEAMASDVHARAHLVSAEMAVSADGRILELKVDDLAEAGAYSVYPRSSILEGLHAVNFAGAVYGCNRYEARLRVAYQNKVGTASYRGVGQPVACGVTEFMVDAAARELGMDPAELRRLNFRTAARDGSVGPTGVDSGGLSHRRCLDELLALMDYPALRAEQLRVRARGRLLGIGLASFVEQNSPGPAFYGRAGVKISAADGCVLRLEPGGGFTCVTSSADQGQGVETTLAQLIAAEFGLEPAAVRIAQGDTVATPLGGGTFASRGLVLSGEAALTAAVRMRERLATVAAAVLGEEATALQVSAGALRSAVTGASLTLAELATLLHFERHRLPAGIEAEASVCAELAVPFPYLLANGAQASLVEVDRDTGFVRLLRHWLVEDCGRVVNPLLADEQLRGGVIQGIGAALFEECRYDERGQSLTGTLADYLLPMSGAVPDILIRHVESVVPGTRLGAKGVGEAGTIGAAAAVGNAINDAIGFLGAEVTRQPYTPERILEALRRSPAPERVAAAAAAA